MDAAEAKADAEPTDENEQAYVDSIMRMEEAVGVVGAILNPQRCGSGEA